MFRVFVFFFFFFQAEDGIRDYKVTGVQTCALPISAILRAIEDAGEHDQAGYRLEMKGERQQHRDGGDRPDARQHADQGTDQRPNKREAEIGGRERDAEAEREIVEKLHHHTGQTGIVKPSPRMKIAQHSATSTTAATSVSHALMSLAAIAPMPMRRRTETTKPTCSMASAKAERLAVTMTTGRTCRTVTRSGGAVLSRKP